MFDIYGVPMFQGDIGNITKKKLAEIQNAETFRIVFYRLVNMALDYRYTFNNLPDTMDERVIKQSLLFYGCVCLFRINGTPIGLSGVQDGSAIDIYGNPKSAYVFSRNGMINKNVLLNYKYDIDLINNFNLGVLNKNDFLKDPALTDGVLVWENKSRVPFIWQTIWFAERISDTLRTLDSVKRWMKKPIIFKCAESEKNNLDEFMKKFMNNEDFATSINSHNIDQLDIFEVQSNGDTAKTVTELVEWYEAQYRMLLGVFASGSQNKKGENLLTEEIDLDEEYIDLNCNSVIEEMQSQIDVYNKLAGTNIEVSITKTQEEMDEEEEEAEEMFNN